MLQMIQLNTLEDRCIKDKQNWDEAAQFLTSSLEHNLKVNYLFFIFYFISCQCMIFFYLVY